MGPGRWGSRGDIKLGVSVTYADINNTAMLGLVGTAAVLYAVQVVVGALQIWTTLEPWAVTLHLALGSLIWALLLSAAIYGWYSARAAVLAPTSDAAPTDGLVEVRSWRSTSTISWWLGIISGGWRRRPWHRESHGKPKNISCPCWRTWMMIPRWKR